MIILDDSTSMDKLIKNKQSGFGLIQVVIAASLMSVVSLGVANLIVSQAQQTSYMEDRMTHLNLKAEVENLVKKSMENCTASILSTPLPKQNKLKNITLKDKDGNIIFDPSNKNKNTLDRVEISKVYVKDINVHSGGTGSGEIEIVVEPKRMRKGGGPEIMKPIVIRQSVTMNTGNNELTACTGGGDLDAMSCVYKDFTNKRNSSFRDHTSLRKNSPRIDSYPRLFNTGGYIVGSFKAPNDASVVKLNIPARNVGRPDRCDGGNRGDCTYPEIEMVLFPGVTKIGGTTVRKGQNLRKVTTNVKRYDYSKCDDSKSATGTDITWYYGSTKLVTIERHRSGYSGCGTVQIHQRNLMANVIPPMCGRANARHVASIPDNLNFTVYKNEE